jgi:hypothetical protein
VPIINLSINHREGPKPTMSDVLDPIAGLAEGTRTRAIEFICHVEGAAAFLKAAHASDRVRIEPADSTAQRRASGGHRGWYSYVLTHAASQLRQIIVVFDKHPARGPDAGAELEAFRMLADLTTAGPQLHALVRRDRSLAVKELARHLDLVRQQFEATAALADTLDDSGAPEGDDTDKPSDAAFEDVSEALLEQAGGSLSLTEATKLLGVSRQALHKRIVAGTALAMMVGNELAVPKLQFSKKGDRSEILPGVGPVTKLFKETGAGPWMALQFLANPDPNLGSSPIEALRIGDARPVLQAARAHLHMDEE